MTFGPKDYALYEALISKTRIILTSDFFGGAYAPPFCAIGRL